MGLIPLEITAHRGLFRDTNLHVGDTGGAGRSDKPLTGYTYDTLVVIAGAPHGVNVGNVSE